MSLFIGIIRDAISSLRFIPFFSLRAVLVIPLYKIHLLLLMIILGLFEIGCIIGITHGLVDDWLTVITVIVFEIDFKELLI